MDNATHDLRRVTTTAGEGAFAVTLELTDTGAGIVGILYGGTLPHVGGTALCSPGPELHGKVLSHADLWQVTVPGHKDAEAAAAVAKRLCVALACPVSVTAGIHVDDATLDDIKALSANCIAAADAAIAELQG